MAIIGSYKKRFIKQILLFFWVKNWFLLQKMFLLVLFLIILIILFQ